MHVINYFNRALTHQFDRSVYVVCCHQRTTTLPSTRCDHCQTCH